jgi:hypothetical protein
MEDKMLNLHNDYNFETNMREIDIDRINALENRLSKAKSTIVKLKDAMSTIKNNDKLKRKFEERIVEESELALEILYKIKDFRKRVDRKLAS